jgi:hypothetical protein
LRISLAWLVDIAARAETEVFLTDLDSRAAVKGSRDPLGLVPLWGQFGRHVVGNLTTVTGSVRGFTTLLLGYHFAREVQEREGGKGESTLALFLKFEQLAAYSRYHAAKDGEFRGIDRVKLKLAESADRVRLSARLEDQILANQKVYGLWGLFSGPSRASGLLERDEAVLTPAAQAFVEREYLAHLSKEGFKDGREIVELLRQPAVEVQLGGRHKGLARALAHVFRPKYSVGERAFYREHLAVGGHGAATNGLQSQLALLMEDLPPSTPFERRELRGLIKESARRGCEPLTARLQRIDILESVLVPAAFAFGFLLSRHSQTLVSTAREIADEWGPLRFVDVPAFQTLQLEVGEAFHDVAAGERWGRVAAALSAGEYEALVRLLLEHNAFVMQSRNGSNPWVRLAHGRLDVRFRDEVVDLPNRRGLPEMWVNNYFLNPLKSVVSTLRAA